MITLLRLRLEVTGPGTATMGSVGFQPTLAVAVFMAAQLANLKAIIKPFLLIALLRLRLEVTGPGTARMGSVGFQPTLAVAVFMAAQLAKLQTLIKLLF